MSERLPFQVAFLTARSNPRCWYLHPFQSAFLAALNLPAEAAYPLNFPYQPKSQPYSTIPIVPASLNNARLYLRSRHPSFEREFQPSLLGLLDRADRTVLLAGSCGLELLLNSRLPDESMNSIDVFAFGPVARARPRCRCVLVQGDRDWLSRHYFPRVDCRVRCGHMGYLHSSEVLELCRDFVRGISGEAR